jgi:UDP-N-acetylmuramate--alanine ligase
LKNNIPTLSRAELMGYIISGFDCSLGVCGSHGKSTATAMLASIFAEAGWDPTVLCGADLGDGSCYRGGSTRLIIYESCEYRDSFLCFSPTASLVLNIDFDHADYFKSISDLQSSFLRSADLTSDLLVYSSDDDNSACLRHVPGNKTVRTFGGGREADYRYSILGYTTEGTEFTVTDKGGSTRLFLPLFGEHFVADAAGAYAIARELGVCASHCAHAISKFRGIPRRLEKLGCIMGYDVYYDYAHHPKEIRAAKEALALMGYGSVCAVFCPHTYSRTAALWSDFVFQLSELSLVYVTDIYAAREAPIEGVESEALVKEINAHGGNSFYLSEGRDPKLPVAVGKSALVLMGAGDLEKIKEKILNSGLT